MNELSNIIKEKDIYIDNQKTHYTIRTNGDVFNKVTRSVMRGGRDKDGYHIISLSLNGKKYTRKIHRLVAEAFLRNPDNLPEVNHKNCNKWDNFVGNLEWCTSAYNTHHAADNNLRPSVLTEYKVKKICKLLEQNKLSSGEIANRFNISKTQVYRIKNGYIWSSVSCDYNIDNYDIKTVYKGESNPSSVITTKQAKKICKLLEKGKTPTEVSKKLNIPRSIVYRIKNRKSWTSVSEKYDF